MNDSTRKLLCAMTGKQWHEISLEDGGWRCACGKVFAWDAAEDAQNHIKDSNPTFDTPDDQHAVMQAICKAGKWGEFYWFALSAWNEREIEDFYGDEGFARWFMDPSRFCELVGEWAGALKDEWWLDK